MNRADQGPPSRRALLAGTAGLAVFASGAGCLGLGADAEDDGSAGNGDAGGPDDVEAVPDFPRVEDPPDAVYVPTHRESMRVLEPVDAGPYAVTPMLSYPHRFWLVDGTDARAVEPDDDRGVHLALVVWDPELSVVLPTPDGTEVRVDRDGEAVVGPFSPWPMLSQGMGLHVGDNVPLPADDAYEVTVRIPPTSTALTGDLAGRFGEGGTATFEFAYDDAFREDVVGGVEFLEERYWGEPGALEPSHGDANTSSSEDDGTHVPYSSVPAAADLPGAHLGTRQMGDAAFVATLLDPGSRFVDADERYLLVSPRTPYNAVPLAYTGLDATVRRDGEAVDPVELERRVDGAIGHHYGSALGTVDGGDRIELDVGAPPQVARHQGYETAFLTAETVTFEVPGGERA